MADTGGRRDVQPRHRGPVLLGLVAMLIGGCVLFGRPPQPIAAVGTIDQCLGGWPVIRFEGEGWKDALPNDLRTSAPGYIPVAAWPDDSHFDEAAGQLLAANGGALFSKGDRVSIKGSIVEVHGDPSPCYYTLGVRIDSIASP